MNGVKLTLRKILVYILMITLLASTISIPVFAKDSINNGMIFTITNDTYNGKTSDSESIIPDYQGSSSFIDNTNRNEETESSGQGTSRFR